MQQRTATALVITAAIALFALVAVAQQQRFPTLASLFPGGAGTVTVGPSPPGTSGTDAQSCASCHLEIAQEWQRSAHRIAWTDDLFRSSFAVEPQAFCRNCHAPLTPPGADSPDALAAREGISCAVCHVRDGNVLGEGAGRGDTAVASAAPHPVRAMPEMNESRYCAGCHQFDFPTPPGTEATPRAANEPMQNTFREWLASTVASRGTTCQDCHMPWRTLPDGRRYRSHSFPGVNDAGLMGRAVRANVTALRDGDDVLITAAITANETGHAFPTGDLFREAEFTAWVEGAPVADSARVTLSRRYGSVRVVTGTRAQLLRRQAADTRVPPPGVGEPRVVNVHLMAPRGMRVHWALDHLRMPSTRARIDGVPDARNRTRVLEGDALP